MSGEYLMCHRSYSGDHDKTTSSYCIISCSGKKSPEIESQATVLCAKHDSSEYFLNNGEPDENANLPGTSGCGSRRTTAHHFTLCHSPPCLPPPHPHLHPGASRGQILDVQLTNSCLLQEGTMGQWAICIQIPGSSFSTPTLSMRPWAIALTFLYLINFFVKQT